MYKIKEQKVINNKFWSISQKDILINLLSWIQFHFNIINNTIITRIKIESNKTTDINKFYLFTKSGQFQSFCPGQFDRDFEILKKFQLLSDFP